MLIFSSEKVADSIGKCDEFTLEIEHFAASVLYILSLRVIHGLQQDVGVGIDYYMVQEGASTLSSKFLASTTASAYLLNFFTPFSHVAFRVLSLELRFSAHFVVDKT